MHRNIRMIPCFLLMAALSRLAVAEAPLPTQEVFKRFANRVVQVRIVDRATESKSVIGSGFFVGPHHLVTNYHVVSEIVHAPERHRAELVYDNGATIPLEVENIDVVHDLAVVRAETTSPASFAFQEALPPKGQRLFSLGNPYDLGSSIVEGTYNGLLEESLYEKIHFTGAINPGMSGGPTITPSGQVVGINVATAGDELSFLVPAKYAAALVKATLDPQFQRPASLLDLVGEQLRANQDVYMARLLAQPFEPVALGEYKLPGKLASFFKCWGHTEKAQDDRPYEVVRYDCSLEDSIFLTEERSSGSISLQHLLLRSDQLNRFQFSALYESTFGTLLGTRGSDDDLTRYECESSYVERPGTAWKVVLCVRAYKKLSGLYDAVLKAASLNHNTDGVQTAVSINGVTFESIQRFTRHYLEALSWSN
ncbi:MAG: trypsin-like peptidase domain-containing protein [Deltaproteobacteria bacterium]|nr:trypsin-like peptidase domain-containing protein [Deltaproteobacteria bacterium]